MTKQHDKNRSLARSTSSEEPRYAHRQGQFLAFIYDYTKIHKQPPAEADIAACFGISPPSAHQAILTLEKRGLINRVLGQARSFRVLLSRQESPDLE